MCSTLCTVLTRHPAALMLFCCLLCIGYPPAFSVEQGRSSLLSPYFSISSNTSEKIVLSWDIPAGQAGASHETLLFIHGEISDASTEVTRFEWEARLEDHSIQSGTEGDFPKSYQSRKPTPVLREFGKLAGSRAAQLRLNFPSASFNSGEENVLVSIPKGEITIRFLKNDPDRFVSFSKEVDAIAKQLFLNYPPLRQAAVNYQSHPLPPYLENPALKLTTLKDGIHKVSTHEIRDHFGLANTAELTTLTLFREDNYIPGIWVDNNGNIKPDGTISDVDSLLFYAPLSDSAFSPDTVTWIIQNKQPGLPLNEIPLGSEAGASNELERKVVLEEDLVFIDGKERNDKQSQYWMWHSLNENSLSIPLSINDEISSPTIALTLFMMCKDDYQTIDPTQLSVRLNLTGLDYIADKMSSNSSEYRFLFSVDANQIDPASNTLEIGYTATTTGEKFLNRIELVYTTPAVPSVEPFLNKTTARSLLNTPDDVASVWFINNNGASNNGYAFSFRPGDTLRLPGLSEDTRLFLLPHNASLPSATIEVVRRQSATSLYTKPQCDVIILSPETWLPLLEPLQESIRNSGYTLRTAAVEDVYDAFGDGRLSPYAIKNFVHYAFHNWEKPQPSYVIFIGDATWDYWGRYRNGVRNFIPAYQEDGDYAVESWFVRCDDPDDLLPDMILSRIPVQTEEMVRSVVQKTIQYKTNPPLDQWFNRVFVLTDNDFEKYTEELTEQWIPNDFLTIQKHIADYPLIDNIYLPAQLRQSMRAKTSLVATQDIVDRLNKGVFLWEFFGHGAPNVMGNERMFFGGGSKFSDVIRLADTSKPAILWSFSCETTRFDYPQDKWNISIGEDLLSHPGNGVVALLGATGRGYPQEHILLARGMHEAAFFYQLPTFGMQHFAGQLLGLSSQVKYEPINQFTIFGDPTILMPRFISINGSITADDEGFSYRWELPEELENPVHASFWKQPADGEPQTEFVPTDNNIISGKITQSRDSDKKLLSVGLEVISKNKDRVVVGHGKLSVPTPNPLDFYIEPATGKIPDLHFLPSSFSFNPASPRSGETVFLNAKVKNSGKASAKDVYVQGVSINSGNSRIPLKAVVGKEGAFVPLLNPGEVQAIRVRWDPTQNAGEQTLSLEIDPNNRIEEENESNNTVEHELNILRKADLVLDATQVTLTPSTDGQKRNVRFEVINIGESLAEKVQIKISITTNDITKTNFIPPREPFYTSIEPGKSYSGGFSIPANVDTFEMNVDPEQIVDEETHENNIFVYTRK